MIEENNETKLNEENEKASEGIAEKVETETEENNVEQEVEVQEVEQLMKEDSEDAKKSGTFVKFLKSFFASIVDAVICLGISVALLFAIDAILRATVGLFFVSSQIYTVVLIIFAVVIVLYDSICKTTTKGTTLGENLIK